MAHVTVRYEMYIPAGHHRQPRNTGALLDLAPPSGADVPNPGIYTPSFFPQLPYSYNGGAGLAKQLFWSVTDGTIGQVLAPQSMTQTVAGLPLQIGAWYFPISGPLGGPGPSSIIDDAFSVRLNTFIDDTFVDVTSDPALTQDANVVGLVPTESDETLQAALGVRSTPEPFYQWVLNDQLCPVGSNPLQVPAETQGIAVAIYNEAQALQVQRPPYEVAIDWLWYFRTHGGLVAPGPLPTWLRELEAVFELTRAAAAGMSRELQVATLRIGLRQMAVAANALESQINSLAKGLE